MQQFTYQLSERKFMKKILIGILFFAGLISVTQVWAVQESSGRDNNRIKNQIKETVKAIKEQVKKQEEQIKEKIATRAGDIKLFKGTKIVITQGELTGINGTILTIKKDDKSLQVLTDDKTQFRRKFWGKSEISEFSIGDKLNVMGTWTDDTKTIIQARFIRDISIQMRHGVFFGEVKSISGSTIVMSSKKRGEQTVTVDDATKIINRKQGVLNLSDIVPGHRIRVKGLWNSLNSVITEVTQIKDFSLPIQPKFSTAPSVKPTSQPTPTAVPSVSPSPIPSPAI